MKNTINTIPAAVNPAARRYAVIIEDMPGIIGYFSAADVMHYAWSIRRAAAARYDCPVNDIVMSVCVRRGWDNARDAARINALTDNGLMDSGAAKYYLWSHLPARDNEPKNMDNAARQVAYCAAILKVYARNDIGRSATKYDDDDRQIYQGYDGIQESVRWSYGQYIAPSNEVTADFAGDVNELWAIVEKRLVNTAAESARDARREEIGKPPLNLCSIIYNSARNVARAVNNAEHKSANTITTIIDHDGTEKQLIDIMPGAGVEMTDAAAITKISIDAAAADDVDRAIISGRVQGFTIKEIAKNSAVNMSYVAVAKRLKNISARYGKTGTNPEIAARNIKYWEYAAAVAARNMDSDDEKAAAYYAKLAKRAAARINAINHAAGNGKK